MLYKKHMNFRALKRHLRLGGVIAYPTESCFGLGCDPNNRNAVKKILRLKQRPQSKGVILIAADFSQLKRYTAPLTKAQSQQIQTTWPGPHTWLLPKSADCPFWLTGRHDKIAVRVTAHRPAVRLCRRLDMALVSTSANISGGRAIRTARECQRQFGSQVLIVAGLVGKRRKPSTIQDLISGATLR
jgi:L-threonylcarbamoyladenylate synthase